MNRNFYNLQKIQLILIFSSFFNIVNAQSPVADFNVCTKTIEQHETIRLIDLTTNSPYAWEWDVYDSTTYLNDPFNGPVIDLNSGYIFADPYLTGNDQYSQTPEFQFDLPGCYTIKLRAINQNGTSTTVRKCIVKVIHIHSINLGFGNYNGLNFNFGKIYDNGGINLNYTNNQGSGTLSEVKILPTNNKKITIDFKQIKLADAGDFITIYDSDTISSNILAVITNANNGQNLTFTSTQSKMYLTFESNSSGVDSGFYAEFYTDYNPYILNKEINVARNLVNVQSVFTNNNQGDFIKNYNRKWYVNNNLQSSFTNMDSLKYTFTNISAYQVCLEMSNCDTSFQTCIIDSNKTCEAYFEIYPDTTLNYSGIIQDLSTASSSATYLWKFGDGDSSSLRTPTHTYSGQGKFNLCLTINDSACISNYCKTIDFDTSGNMIAAIIPFSIKIVDKNGNALGFNKINLKNFHFFPNPVQSFLTIKDFDFNNYKIEIYNSLGQIVNNSIVTETIDFTEFTNGIYFLKITNSLGESESYKILKY